jgi:hypothetical protein
MTNAAPREKKYVALPKRHHTCKTCNGRIHFYPQPGQALPPRGAGGYLHEHVSGAWAHLDRKDWLDNPHPAEPATVDA